MKRRLPYSRAFAQAGFTRDEAEDWRLAGWHDADEAAAWKAIGSERSPRQLRDLARRGFSPAQVLALDSDGPEIDLRDSVLRNLHRDAPSRWASDVPSGRPRP